MIRVRCPRCGRPNPGDTNKCIHCGLILRNALNKTMADLGLDRYYHAYLRYYPKERVEKSIRALIQ